MKRHRLHDSGLAGGLLLAAVAAVLSPLAVAAGSQDQGERPIREHLDETRSALSEWVEIQDVISREKRDWALGRELLTDRIQLVRREIESLRARIDEADEEIAEADEKRVELGDELERYEQSAAGLTSTIASLEERTRTLLARLPEPLLERVRPLSQKLPDDPETTKLSISERFQFVVGILNSVNKFNREITTSSEVRTLADGTSAEVAALYLGIAYGFYVSADGGSAGVGKATAEGWTWTATDDAAEAIALAVAIHENEKPAAFVPLPVVID